MNSDKPEERKPELTIRIYEEAIVRAVAQAAPLDNGPFRRTTVLRWLSRICDREYARAMSQGTNKRHGAIWEIVIVPDQTDNVPPMKHEEAFLTAEYAPYVRKALAPNVLRQIAVTMGFLIADSMASELNVRSDQCRVAILAYQVHYVCRRLNEVLGVAPSRNPLDFRASRKKMAYRKSKGHDDGMEHDEYADRFGW